METIKFNHFLAIMKTSKKMLLIIDLIKLYFNKNNLLSFLGSLLKFVNISCNQGKDLSRLYFIKYSKLTLTVRLSWSIVNLYIPKVLTCVSRSGSFKQILYTSNQLFVVYILRRWGLRSIIELSYDCLKV